MSNKKNRLIYLLFVFSIFILFPKNVFAVTINISNCPAVITTNSFNVDVSVSGASDGKNYLRIDLYKEGTTRYFGETFNGNEWYSGSIGTSYFAVDIIDSTASAKLEGRVGNPSLTEYPGPGNYKLRIRRYTASGSSSSSDQTPVNVTIQVTTPTPEPTSEPTATVISTPPNSPTLTSTSTPVATKTPTLKPKSTPTSKPTEKSNGEEVLGVQSESGSPNPTEESEESSEKSKVSILSLVFIVLGISFVGFSGFAFFKQKGLNNNESEKGKEII